MAVSLRSVVDVFYEHSLLGMRAFDHPIQQRVLFFPFTIMGDVAMVADLRNAP